MGIDGTPYFSWEIESDLQNVIQSAYRIQVYQAEQCIWDSKVQHSQQTTFIFYEGESLESSTLYKWNVSVWDNHGNMASGQADFETALLNLKDWKAKWVESTIRHRKKTPAVMFRKDFEVGNGLISAKVYATCHGIYYMSMNGNQVDSRKFAPEYTAYDKCLYYQTYDVTGLLREGKNTIGMYVGDGWFFSMMSKKRGRKSFSKYHGILFQIELQYQNEKREWILSDESVLCSVGPVQYSDLYRGEIYDAQKTVNNWDTPHCDLQQWKKCKITYFPMNNLKAQALDPIRLYKELPVKKVLTTPKGEKVLDFGQNFAGYVRMKLHIPKGTSVTLEHSETLDKDGNYFNNIQGINQKDTYLSNGEEITYEPLFTFHGFRYVRVTGISTLRAEDFTGVALTSESVSVGSFICSDTHINRLVENSLWSQRSNMFSIPTDCPQREKAGWTGDIGLYGRTALQNEDLTAFLTSWLTNMALEQKKDGQIPPVIPFSDFYIMTSKLQPILMGGSPKTISSSGWGDCCVDVPYDMYCLTGNTAILRQQYLVMKKWLAYVEKQARTKKGKNSGVEKSKEQYLWNSGFHYGEWLIPSCCEKGGSLSKENLASAKEGKNYVAPLYFYSSCTKMKKIAEVLGEEADANYYKGLAQKILDACQSSLLTSDNRLRYERQGAYVIALKAGIIPESKKKQFAGRLAELIHQNGDKLDTGFLGTQYLLDALSENGYGELAYHLLIQPENPGWMYEVKNNATTIWESWNCFDKNGNIQLMSMNHYAFGCVCDWIYRNITGIDLLEPGFKKIRIAPQIYGDLTYASRIFHCEYGEVESSWNIENNIFRLDVRIPCNTTAVIELPDKKTEIVGSGTYHFSLENIKEILSNRRKN